MMFRKIGPVFQGEAGTGEGAGANGGEPAAIADDHWAKGIEDEGLRTTAAGFDDQAAMLAAIGYQAPEPQEPGDWRTSITDESAQKFAEKSPDLNHLVSRALDMQGKLSQAIVRPGQDATEEQIAAYRKQIGVPETEEGYEFEIPDGEDLTDADKAFHATMGKIFHGLDITADQAKALNVGFNEYTKVAKQEQIAQDQKFADEAEADLHKQWPGKEYALNKEYADRAATWAFGDQLDEVRHLETADGRFVMDHPIMLRALAAIGREMQEGGLVPPMTEEMSDQIDDQIAGLRQKARDAKAQGDTKAANKFYEQEQALIARKSGNRGIVGAEGRTV